MRILFVGSKDSMQALEARFLDGDWTPSTTSDETSVSCAINDIQASDDCPPKKKVCCRQKNGKENAPPSSRTWH